MPPDYSATVLDHFSNPRNVGPMDDPDAIGTAGKPGRGNYMVIYVKLRGGSIERASFMTYGCPPAIAAGSLTTELITGGTIEQALNITPEQLTDALGGLPLGKGHCAGLAVEAINKAFRPDDDQNAT